jgi:hypothetical protein
VANARVRGKDFSFALEEKGARGTSEQDLIRDLDLLLSSSAAPMLLLKGGACEESSKVFTYSNATA